jgi:hypothetical protein
MSATPGTTAPSPPLSFGQRLTGMFSSPNRVFASFRDHPKWVDMLLLFAVLSALSFFPIQGVIRSESITQMREQVESSESIPDERKTEVIDQQTEFFQGPMFTVMGTVGALVASPMMLLFWAFFIWAVYGFATGGDLNFKQSLAVTAHLGILFVAAGFLKIPMILAKGSVHASTSLALLSPDPDPRSLIYNLLDSFDIFTIAILAVLASGMTALMGISGGKSRGLAITIFVLALVVRVAFSQVGKLFGG